MWSDVIEKVQEKFSQLRKQGWDAFVDEDASHQEKVTQLYESLTWEMVQGIGLLFLEMVQNLNYISKQISLPNPRMYEEMHVLIMEKLEESIQKEVQTIPQFYLHIKDAVDSFHTYCRLLKQDIGMHHYYAPRTKMDRKLRQTYLVLKELLEGFQRMNRQHELLLHVVGGEQAEKALDEIVADADDLRDLLDSSGFSEAEKQFLEKALNRK